MIDENINLDEAISDIDVLVNSVKKFAGSPGFVRVLKIHESPRYFSCQNYVLKSP